MANRAPQATAAIVAATTLLSAGSTAASEETATLVLRVENHAGVSPEILRQAEKHATRIYDDIGVRTIWVHDGSRYPGLRPRHLSVLILSREMAEQKISARKLGDTVVGVGNPVTGRAHIFADRIAAVAAKKQRDRATVLGLVLAHEVGHMVLPTHGHSSTGIMSADLSVKSKNLRYFTATQGALIRTRLTASGANETATVELAEAAMMAR